MEKRLSELDNVYFKHMVYVLRMAAIFFVFAIIGCGLLVRAGILDKSYYAGDALFFSLSALMVLVAVCQWVNKHSYAPVQTFLAICYHVIAVTFLLYVSGIWSPFLLCWIALFLGTDLYFGNKGALLNMATLALTYVLSLVIWSNTDTSHNLLVMLAILFILAISFIISRIRQLTEQERRAYNKSRQLEGLQRERLSTLLNAMGDAVISTDERGIIHVYNAAALSLLDTNATLSGLGIDTVLKLKDDDGQPVKLMPLLKKRAAAFTRTDLCYAYNATDQINLYLNVSPIRPSYQQSTVQRGYIFILRDITKEKSLEEERDEFISVVSHELRTPVAITEGNISNVQLVLDRDARPESKQLKNALGAAHEQILYLAGMINDLSTLSRAERGVADAPEAIDVRDMLEAMYKEYRPEAEKKGLRLDLELAPKLKPVHASRLYLEEMLQNFITNALKYTEEGSVTITAHNTANGVEFAVRDSGIGISKSDQAKIFNKFYRSEDYRTRETSGTGLGLYVVQKLAQKLGTRVEVKSRLNHGSAFSFVLSDKTPLAKKGASAVY